MKKKIFFRKSFDKMNCIFIGSKSIHGTYKCIKIRLCGRWVPETLPDFVPFRSGLTSQLRKFFLSWNSNVKLSPSPRKNIWSETTFLPWQRICLMEPGIWKVIISAGVIVSYRVIIGLWRENRLSKMGNIVYTVAWTLINLMWKPGDYEITVLIILYTKDVWMNS